jgi:cobalt-zinc-cadmium efflux system outer membrane protein
MMRSTMLVVLMLALANAANAGQSAGSPPIQPDNPYQDRQQGLSLDDAIAMAIALEPGLRAARADLDVARAMRTQAGLRPNPSTSVEYRGEPGGTDNQTMVSVQWPLDLSRRAGRTNVADREIAASELALLDRQRMLAADVRSRYGDVLGGIRDLALLDDLVAAAARQRDLLRSRVQEGASPPLERDLIQVELQRLQSDRLLQAGRIEAALVALKRSVGAEPEAPLLVRDTLETLVQRESVSTSGVPDGSAFEQQRPDIREAAARIAIADAKAERAARDGRIDVSLFGSYQRMDAGFPQFALAQDGGLERIRGVFHYISGGAMLSIPLFNRNQGEIAAARAEQASAQASHDATRLSAKSEVAAARILDARTHEAARMYGGDAQTLARQNLEVVNQSYGLGRVTVFDVLAEQRRFLEVQRAYTDALRAAFDARTVLLRALGGVQ